RIITQVQSAFPAGAAFIANQLSSQAARVFDGLHVYSFAGAIHSLLIPQLQHWAATNYPHWVKLAGPNHISCVTIMPGYDDRSQTQRSPPYVVLDRHGGATYSTLWRQAIAAHPNWILITSWNEWHEGTEIEPSKEFGNTALLTTQVHTHQHLRGSSR